MPKQWVIPDIHGCKRSLISLIETQIVPSKEDMLYFLGDFVDRGPDSKGVLDYVMGLQEQGYNIVALKGNHEEFFVNSYDEEKEIKSFLFFKQANKSKTQWLKHGGEEAMQSFGTENMLDIPEHYIEWMRNLPLYHLLDKYVLVHAGLNFEIPDPFEDTQTMLWVREFKVKSYKIGFRKVIHGHVPVSLDFIDLTIKSPSYPFIDLDNGCYMSNRAGFGNLLALELGAMELKIQPNIDMD
ncbi:MAG: serine/threonine protein phosphatase [Bacteroidales bacterium]|nr:serine/threonine protein phosphatase [Bacteroidales bacterium]MBK9357881.1 serine/threonine protein phosphatase [Bacteroidales bacterium]